MGSSKKKNSRKNSPSSETKQTAANIADAVADTEEEYHIDISKYDRTENLEMTDPAQKTIMYSYTGKVSMTGTFEKLSDRQPEKFSDVTLEMTQIPILDLEAEPEDDDQPYSPDNFGRSKTSRMIPAQAGVEMAEHEHHHHHHSSEGEHHHHSSEGEHHHHSSEGEHHRHRSSGNFEDMKAAASDAELRKKKALAEKKAAAKKAESAPASAEKKAAKKNEPAQTPTEKKAERKPEPAPAPAEKKAEKKAETGNAASVKKTETSSAEKPAAKKTKEKPAEIKPLKPLFRVANIAYPAVVFAVLAVAFIVLPRPEISETEQRNLAEFPEFSAESFLNGGYTNGITEYFNDRVPFRDDLKKAAAQVRGAFGVSYGGAEISGPIAVITEEEDNEPEPVIVEDTAPDVTTAAAERTEITTASAPGADESRPAETTAAATTEATTAETTKKPVETTKNVNEIAEGVITNGQVVTKLSDGHWWGISLFGGGKGAKYAASLNRFKQALGDDVNVYSMVVPTAGEYYLPSGYESYSASHQKSIDSIDSQLSGVISVPASMALWEHINEPIYTRTDHHWQPLGAYYAAQCFAETAGLPFADISTMTRVDVDGYMGTMYGFTQSANLLSDPETFTYYKPPRDSYKCWYYDTAYNFTGNFDFFIPMPVSGSYSTFMASDDKIVRIKTNAGTGRKLVVFKDSYGNAEIPFYFGSFDEIWVCDMRYFKLNAIEFIKFTGATDLLFTMCTFSAVGTNADHLDVILSNPVTEIKETAN